MQTYKTTVVCDCGEAIELEVCLMNASFYDACGGVKTEYKVIKESCECSKENLTDKIWKQNVYEEKNKLVEDELKPEVD